MGQLKQSTRKSKGIPASKRVPRPAPISARQPFNRARAILEAFPESVIACDQGGKILWINAAAHRLFEVPADISHQGTAYQRFLERYTCLVSQQAQACAEQWLMNLLVNKETASSAPENATVLYLPGQREVAVTIWQFPLDDSPASRRGTAYTFHDLTHCHQQARHLQQVYETVISFTTAIAQIPEEADFTMAGETLLLTPPVVFVAQHLVDMICRVLNCRRVSLFASHPPALRLYYVAGSGLTYEQEQYVRENEWGYLLEEVYNENVRKRLFANQEALLTSDELLRKIIPPLDKSPESLLMIPLFLEQQLAGVLAVVKAGKGELYSQEEIALVRAVAALATLIIEALSCLHSQAETQIRALVLREVQRLSNDFLTLASHELRTPLTGIIGNLQLAQHRLKELRSHIPRQKQHERDHVGYTQYSLDAASQSAHLLQRIINDLIDDARIQTGHLTLSLVPCDLLTLLNAAVAKQQRVAPERSIIWGKIHREQTVPVLADAERITRVITTYLANALNYSPEKQPVTVELTVDTSIARVLIHDEGPGIPIEEQEHLWERFYRSKGNNVQHELDLSVGLGLYLCREFIERHHGQVGVESIPYQGTTFWFSLPLARYT